MNIAIDFSKHNKEEIRKAVEKVACEKSLYTFVKHAWKYCDPSPFVDGEAIYAICEHLEACVRGRIKRLIVNIPPRMGKSSVISVLFPAWVWAQPPETWSVVSGPGVAFLTASFAKQLSLRDNLKMRRVVQSEWYQSHWGDRFQIMGDQSAKGRFDTDQKGSRLATSVGAATTGEGGNIIIIDDANSASEAFSEAKITEVLDWYDNAVSTRLNNSKKGVIIIVQQRLAVNDLTGHLLENNPDEWVHLCLPMRFEQDRRTFNFIYGPDKEPWTDWRLQEGELLWPERFGEPEIQRLEKTMGATIAAGQLQQRPRIKEGEIIKEEWWQLYEGQTYPPMDYIIASVDTAYTENTANDESAMTVWGVFTSSADSQITKVVSNTPRGTVVDIVRTRQERMAPRIMLMDAWSDRLEFHQLINKIVETAKLNKVDRILIEAKAAGHSVAQEIRRVFSNAEFAVQLVDTPQNQNKVGRLYSVQHLFADRMVFAPDKQFAQKVIDQVASFPKGTRDDLVDTVSMAVRHLRDTGMLIRTDEHAEEVAASLRHTNRNPAPLYPV
jgi:predicted phage terminase large subunit-like protein